MHRPLVFVHVEKVGGITMNYMLHKLMKGYVSPDPIYGPYFSKEAFAFVKKWYPTKITGLGGHKLDPTVKYFDNQYQFSMVREPVKRLLSHYNWQENIMSRNRTIDDFMDIDFFQNFQTYRLTGSKDLAEAKAVIDSRYDLVGLLEHYSETVAIISEEVFGNKTHLRYSHSNIKNFGNKIVISDLTEKQSEKVRMLNSVDIEIYEYIKQKFHQSYDLKEYNVSNDDLRLSGVDNYYRKFANRYVGSVLQPRVQSKVERGY